ncbi:PIG-L family deacetylase [Streptomyces erythrochromogenes]|uniref:PIG-L family deacetylase n=1 Tax=Streptomyces erythrochromogenes TaxID=285574 RepID=UPI00331FB3F9
MPDGHPGPGPTAGDGVPPVYGQYGPYGQYASYEQHGQYQWNQWDQWTEWNQQPQQYHQPHIPHQHQHPEPVREFHHAPQHPQGPQGFAQPFLSQQVHGTPTPETRLPPDAAVAARSAAEAAADPGTADSPARASAPPEQHTGRRATRRARETDAAPPKQQGRRAARRAGGPPPQAQDAAEAALPEQRGRRAARRAGGPQAASQTERGRAAARPGGQGAAEADTTAPHTAGRAARRAARGEAEAAPPEQRGRRAARRAGGASPQARDEAEAAPPQQQGRRAARRAGGPGVTPPARGASPQAQRQAQRPHRWARLVKAVALCAALAATGMLVLRGNEALAGLAAHPPAVATPQATGAVPDPGRIVQIVAHPDDDLYFMNPDLRYSISAGHPVASVYLTAGEADGINATAAKGAATKPDKPAYAEARQNGIRAAYAQMATGDRTSAWQRTVVPTKGGGHAEVDVLVAKPQVNLVWLQLREAGHGYADVPDSLHGLWNGKVARLESMLSSRTPVKQRFAYSKEQVVQTLVGVLEQYRPTTVRFQDPTPGRYPDTKQYTDHQDHFYGARFVQMATAAYAKDVKDRPHFAVQNYVGYFNGSLPSALDPQEAKEKLDSLDTYAWLDRQNHCGSDAGCGDLKVSDRPSGNRWTDTVNYARGTGTDWLTSDKDHGLWAFKVLDGQVAVWHRPGPVGPWRGPDLLPGTGMDPGAGAVTLKDGRIAVFGTRTSFGARPADYRREVVYTVQTQPGADGFGEWQSLGTPETSDETWTSDISAPAVSVDGTGQPAAYVRDGAYGLRGRVQRPDGGWGPWEKLGGEDLHGAPVTATDGAGRRMVLSATSKTVVGWAQPGPGAPLGPVTATGLPDTALPLTAAGREGGVRLWFRKPGSGNVRTALLTADDGLKVNNMTDLGGLNGFGSVTASGHVLAGRAAGGQLGSEVGPGRPWGRSPLMFVGAPSSTTTGRNLVSLALVGLDARLYVTSSADAPDAYLAPWQPVGPRNAAP